MEKHEMKKNEKYMLAVHELFQLIDMERLDDSLNRDNREYANDVIKLMGMTHEIIYGNPSEPDEGEDTVILPAVIRDEESGKSWVGIAECSYFSLPKNLPMYELLQGRALSIEEFHIPREYQAVNLPSEDKLYGHSLTVTVFAGENLTVECSMTVEREEEEVLEEEEETAMTISEKIQQFDEENDPFYLVDHGDGIFSLCLARDFLSGKYENYGQYAFDAYAVENGEEAETSQGRHTHGNGYEWGYVFRKAFQGEKDFGKIAIDCESGGFFCYCTDFELITNLGRQFRELVEDKERFTRLVSEALKEEKLIQQEEERTSRQVRGFLLRHHRSDIDMLTPYGRFLLTAEMGQNLLGGRLEEIRIGETVLSAEEFLDMTVAATREDLIESGYFQMRIESEEEMHEQETGTVMTM